MIEFVIARSVPSGDKQVMVEWDSERDREGRNRVTVSVPLKYWSEFAKAVAEYHPE